jgi:chloramphenicol 3-O phosphotransferase
MSDHGFGFRDLPADRRHPMVEIRYGDVGWRMMAGFHRGVVELIRAGTRSSSTK